MSLYLKYYLYYIILRWLKCKREVLDDIINNEEEAEPIKRGRGRPKQ